MLLALEAHNPELNHHRRYEIEIGKDMFDEWTLSIRYGRVGKVGQAKLFSSKRIGELEPIIRERLRRRMTSQTRIGCSYKITKLEQADSFIASSLLSSELLERLQ
ncbi:MAG: WGR domain-containing protein [Pirellulaceae bacterium]